MTVTLNGVGTRGGVGGRVWDLSPGTAALGRRSVGDGNRAVSVCSNICERRLGEIVGVPGWRKGGDDRRRPLVSCR